MTAPTLEPGDRIHLAVPTTSDNPAYSRAIKDTYARQYVTVVMFTVCPGITRPEIIAVFRPHEQDPS